MKEIAQDDYDYWFSNGKGFLRSATNAFFENKYAIAAFILHQATKSLYNAIFY